MSFHAYLDNIRIKTGKTAADFRMLAAQKGFTEGNALREGVKAGQIITWLATDYGLGRGHAMGIVAVLKGGKKPGDA